MKETIIFISDKDAETIDRIDANNFYFDNEYSELTIYTDLEKRVYSNVKAIYLLEKTEDSIIIDAILDV